MMTNADLAAAVVAGQLEQELSACPTAWDPFDGQTVVHGNDQYKVSLSFSS